MEPAHIEDMDRFFFILLTVCIGFLALLFLPIYIHSDLYYDVNGRKCAFSVTAYRFLPIIGGYIATYNGGLAFHISKKKAILLPYNDMKQEQKKISVLRTFRLKTLAINIETGAEYFLYTMLAQRVFTAYFLLQGGKKEKLNGWECITHFFALRPAFKRVHYTSQRICIFKGENSSIMSDKNQRINHLIGASLDKLDGLADVNTIIGKSIITKSGWQIIPFSKVTLGNLTGGGEYGDAKVIKEMDGVPFAGGSGAVVSMKPMGFLIDDGVSCRILRITDQPLDNLVERAGEIVHDLMSKE